MRIKIRSKQPKMPRWMHYGFNPPEGKPTHYNTLGDIRTEYMHLGELWFFHDGYRWVYMNNEPPVKTPIGEVEPLRVWYPKTQEVKQEQRAFNEGDYYSRFD